ncbi:MAG: YggS family pyridoxal phosphate-dependent enzyme [Candidatus Latescibacteria bacterium]|nr:YggS family pyridoxal phosphate-dependent enzyme [Candidatus Latescibacterota bacterium]
MTLADRLKSVRDRMARAAEQAGRRAEEVTLVAVSKTRTVAEIQEALRAGLQVLGENRVQEAEEKQGSVSLPAHWHLIGHLQTNKVKKAVEIFDLIHSVDSLPLAQEIDRRAERMGKVADALVQVNTSGEESKSGVEPEEALDLIGAVSGLKSVRVRGLMTIGALGAEGDRARPFFVVLRGIRDRVAAARIAGVSMEHLSMGMTGDFEAAIEEGATLVRVGTAIFGVRP